jgi:hypothetical protein
MPTTTIIIQSKLKLDWLLKGILKFMVLIILKYMLQHSVYSQSLLYWLAAHLLYTAIFDVSGAFLEEFWTFSNLQSINLQSYYNRNYFLRIIINFEL